MVKIDVINDKVTIDVLGIHKLWTLKNRVSLARKNIKSVKPVDRTIKPPLWRIPGVYIPWVISAGTYYGRNRKEFWDRTALGEGVELELENDTYTKIIVDVANAQETIEKIRGAA